MSTMETAAVSHTQIAPGIHRIDGAEVYSADSSDGSRIYTVVVAPSGHATCSCRASVPHCRHVREVLAARMAVALEAA